MSNQSYINGFCKASMQHNMDPGALLQLVPVKQAQAGSVWDNVKKVIGKIKQKWDEVDPELKPLVGGLTGAGGGAIGGALAGKLLGFGAGRGALAGAGIGGIGGSLYGAHYGGKQTKAKNLAALKSLAEKNDKALADAVAKGKADVAKVQGDWKADSAARAKALADAVAKGKADVADVKGQWKAETTSLRKAIDASAAKHESEMKGMQSAHEKAMKSLAKEKDDASELLKTQVKNLSDETEVQKKLLDIFQNAGYSAEDVASLSADQQEKLVGALTGYRNRIGDALAHIRAQKAVSGFNPSPSNSANAAAAERRKARFIESRGKVLREIDKEVAAQQEAENARQKRMEVMKDAPYFDWDASQLHK